jgi:hypothetical protein
MPQAFLFSPINICCKIWGFIHNSANSWFVLFLQAPCSLTGPYIFFSVFLSAVFTLTSSLSVVNLVWHIQRTVPAYYIPLSLSLALQPFVGLGRFFSFLILYAVDRTPWTGDQPVARPLPAHRTTQIENNRTQTSMRRVGFESTIWVLERTKTVHASDRAAAMIGCIVFHKIEFFKLRKI